MNELQQTRTLDVVAAEIRTFTASMLNNVIEIGRRLTEAKEMVPYGEWGTWVKTETGYSQSTANNFMKLFDEYGAAQGSLFGASVDSQTFGKLSYTKALALLAVPSDERESFAQEVNAEALSTRELKQAIKERDEARRALEDEREASEGAAIRIGELAAKAEEAREEADFARRDALDAMTKLKELQRHPVEVPRELTDEEKARLVDGIRDEEMAKINDEREAAAEKLKKAKAKAKEAEAKAAAAEQRARAAEDAREAAELASAENAAAANRADALAKHAADLERQLAMADPVTAEFKGIFAGVASGVEKLVELVDKAPADVQPNLRAAMAALAEKLEA